jgi:mannose-6-phosphate isomerase-like protein (cupin superfamily)
MISFAQLSFEVPVKKFQEEVSFLSKDWISHFNTRHYEGEWTVISLRSPGGKMDQIIPDDIQQIEYADTELLSSCPTIKGWLVELRCPLHSVRLLNLKSNSVIKEHRDHELSFESGEARLHIPIFTNPNVEFVLNNEVVTMNEGECWYINANLPHSVANRGNSDRIHLVVDCVVNDWLKGVFDESDRSYVPAAQLNDETIKVIRELRLSNTPVTNKLADELEKGLNKNISS